MARSAKSTSSSSTFANLPPYGILLLRLALGACMIYHGYGKVVPDNAMDHFAHYVVSLGMPYWLGYVSAFTEFAGGIFLILGLFTRLFAFLVTINMLVAIFAVTIHQGYSGSEYAIALAAMAILLLLAGPGKAALDRKIGFS